MTSQITALGFQLSASVFVAYRKRLSFNENLNTLQKNKIL